MAFSLTGSDFAKVIKQNGLMMAHNNYRKDVWDGFHYMMLLVVKIYQMRLFDVNEYEEDLSIELKRMKAHRLKTPYIRDYPKKVKYPE